MGFDIAKDNCNPKCRMCELADRLIAALADADERCARLSLDAIVKPSDSRLLHALVVCELSRNRFAFLRTQLRSLNRSIKRLGCGEQAPPVVIYRNECVPNAMNVLNKIKERLPEGAFTARHNKIQLIEPCDRQALVDALTLVMRGDGGGVVVYR